MDKELYCGIDLHSNNGVYHIVDGDGVTNWHRRLRNEPKQVVGALAPFAGRFEMVAIESTYNWYWLADCLQDAGHPVVLANPSAMDQYEGLKNTDDDSDAAFIAELARLHILPLGWICPREDRSLRDVLRRRMLVVNSRTRQTLSLQSMLTRQTGRRLRRAAIESMDAEELKATLRLENLMLVAQEQLELIAAHDQTIKSMESEALRQCKDRPQFALLNTMPGVGKILAMTILLEIGDIARFPNPGKLSSYARAVKAIRTSNGKKKGCNNSRNGNRYLGWAFIEAVNHAVRVCEPARRWYQRKSSKQLPVVARKALASKLTKAAWYMLTTNSPFDTKRVFG